MPLLLGLIIGFIAAVPLGALNVFAISQTLKRDFIHGYLVGITASLLDILYAYFALVGFAHVLTNITYFMPVIRIVGILLLIGISIRLWFQSRTFKNPKPSERISMTAHKPILTALFLYMSNPVLLAFWIAVAGTLTAHHWVESTRQSALPFAIACGIGSAAWYWLLLRYVARYHHQFSAKTFRRILKLISILLFVFALIILIT